MKKRLVCVHLEFGSSYEAADTGIENSYFLQIPLDNQEVFMEVKE
jgi:hypothetical protein